MEISISELNKLMSEAEENGRKLQAAYQQEVAKPNDLEKFAVEVMRGICNNENKSYFEDLARRFKFIEYRQIPGDINFSEHLVTILKSKGIQ